MRRSCLAIVVSLSAVLLAACSGSSAPEASGGKAASGSASSKAATKTARSAKAGTKAEANPDSAAAAQATVPPEAYAYQSEGRRDPFINILSGGNEPRVVSKRGEGAASVGVNEISVRAVIRSGTLSIANIQGPDGRNYYVRAGDKLMDGTVKSVTPQGLVIVQEVNDPLSVEKQREVRKLLRSQEDAKQ